MTFEDKLVKVAEREQKVYESGQKSMVDESKIIEKTASGTTTLTIDDVSELPHDVEVQLDSNLLEMGEDKILFKSGSYISLTENSISWQGNSGNSSHIFFEKKYGAGTYTLSCDIEGGITNRFLIRCFDSSGNVITNALSDYIAFYQANIFNSQRVKVTIPNTVAYWVWGWCPVGASGELITITNPKIEVGDGLTSYEGIILNVNGNSYSSPSNGLIQGIKSYSPDMTFTTDEGIKIEARYHKSFGMQTEYDRFWNGYKPFNDNCTCMFAGSSWNGKTIKPKNDIFVKNGTMMFYHCNENNVVIDLVECFGDAKLDFSLCTALYQCFACANVSRVGVISLASITTTTNYFLNQAFANSSIETIEEIISKADAIYNDNTFTGCSKLVNVKFSGVIGTDINFKWSTKLSKASHISIFNAASTTASITITFSKTAVNKAFETSSGANNGSTSDEWLNLLATKPNVTVSLV